jgi:zinc transport system permease protein
MEIFQYDFMRLAFAAGIAVAVLCPLIGSFLVLKRYSLLADTLAHVALTGVAIGFLTNASPIIMAVAITVVAALLIERLRGTKKIYGESVLAIFLSGSLAIAVLLISIGRGFNIDLFNFLFGTIVAIRPLDAYLTTLLAAFVTIGIMVLYRPLLYLAVDEEGARISGIKHRRINSLMMVAAAITVAVAMRVVGALLVGALMVIPAVSAFQISRSFRNSMFLAVFFSVFSVLAGLFAAYYLDLAAGGSIVTVSLLIFLFVTIFKKQ